MLVFQIQQDNRVALLFGQGLVGSAITRQLKKQGDLILEIKTDWSNVDKTCEQIQHLELPETNQLEIIWSAGKAGFSASIEDIDKEFDFFSKTVDALITKFGSKHSNCRFWLMSSAGGLFEGQTHVSIDSLPNPKRPYADLKLKQENYIRKKLGDKQSVICRISSVYTNSNISGRLGLIPVLVKNGIQNKISIIVGNESTIRDYVLDDDIGKFVANNLNSGLHGIQYLINGVPLSIQFIKNAIEQITLKKLYLRYLVQKTNSENISFIKHLQAKNFEASPMVSNIRILYNKILSSTNI